MFVSRVFLAPKTTYMLLFIYYFILPIFCHRICCVVALILALEVYWVTCTRSRPSLVIPLSMTPTLRAFEGAATVWQILGLFVGPSGPWRSGVAKAGKS